MVRCMDFDSCLLKAGSPFSSRIGQKLWAKTYSNAMHSHEPPAPATDRTNIVGRNILKRDAQENKGDGSGVTKQGQEEVQRSGCCVRG